MQDAAAVAEVLGLKSRRRVTTGDLIEHIKQGLPKSSLRRVAGHVTSDPRDARKIMRRIVPEATFKRRRERLSSAESERTERLARVVAVAEFVRLQEPEQARCFLTTPHPQLDGRPPIEVAMTELGARQVEDLLASIVHGLPA